MKRPFIYDPENPRRDEVMRSLSACIRGWGGRCTILVSDPAKSREQEEKYHAIIGEIADANTVYGKRLDPESWKRLLIDAFKHDTRSDPDLRGEWERFGELQLLPALNHAGFVAVGEQSRKFSKKLASAFIEWLLAYQAEGPAEAAA